MIKYDTLYSKDSKNKINDKVIPLRTSKTKITKPISVPKILKVFVAPVPPLPWFLRSIPLISLPNQTESGIDPNKYDMMFNNFYPIYKKKLTNI